MNHTVSIRPNPNLAAYSSSALERSKVILERKGTLHTVVVANNAASQRYLQIFDATSLPSNGAVPVMTFPIAAGTTEIIELGLRMETGLVVALSSTFASLTIVVADEALFHVRNI